MTHATAAIQSRIAAVSPVRHPDLSPESRSEAARIPLSPWNVH